MVGPAGEQVGIVRVEDAMRLAAESDLDLVEVAPQAKPPVAKLMDYGKYKYEAAVKAREARKNQTNTVLKEIRFRLKIDDHDYKTKTGHALRFLNAGDKVKAMIQFRGREQQRPEMGIRLLNRFAEDVAEAGIVESAPRQDGRNMVMVIGPIKNKAEARAEARRAAQRAESLAQNEAKAKSDAKAEAKAKRRIDVTGDGQPMSQSMGDLMPEELRAAMAEQAEESPAAKQAEAKATEDSIAEVKAEIAENADAKTKADGAGKAESTGKAESAGKTAPKPAAAKAAPKPAAAKPAKSAAKPAAPKAATPSNVTAKPTAAKPAAGKTSAAKSATSKTTGTKSTAAKSTRSTKSQDKAGE